MTKRSGRKYGTAREGHQPQIGIVNIVLDKATLTCYEGGPRISVRVSVSSDAELLVKKFNCRQVEVNPR